MKNGSYGRLTVIVLVAAMVCGIGKVQAQQETQQGSMEQEF